MALSRLPTEVLEEILLFHSLSAADWQAIRLVSKQFNSLVTPRLFSSLTAWLDISCLERLVSISKHEKLRNYVVNLEIQITDAFGDPFHGRFRVDDDDGDENEERHLRENFFRKLVLQRNINEMRSYLNFDNVGIVIGRPEWGRKELEAAFKSYRTFIKQQYALMYTGMAQAYLAIALSNFPNLRHQKLAALVLYDSYADLTPRLPAWGIRAMEKKILVEVHVEGSAYRSRQLEKVLCAMACSDLSLNTLEIDDSGWEFLTHQLLEMARRAWRSVERLVVVLSDAKYSVQSETMKRLRQVLTVMPKLTQLLIHQFADREYKRLVNISTLLQGSVSLKCLRRLELHNFVFTNEAFSSFLNRHHTLSTLHLCNITIEVPGGIWTLINSIRDAPQLNEVQISGNLAEYHEDCSDNVCWVNFEDMAAVHRFAMRQTDDWPKLENFVCKCAVGYPAEVLPNAATVE